MKRLLIAILILISASSFGQTKKYGERLNANLSIDSFYYKLNIISDSIFAYSNDAFVAFRVQYYIDRGLPIPAAFSNFHLCADEVYRNFVPRAQAVDPTGITNSTTVGQNLLSLATPISVSLASVNSDGTVGTRTITQAKSDLSIDLVDNTSDANKPLSIADVAALAGKASSSHTHAYSSLTSIPSTFAPSAHTHAESEITNLVTDLAGKSPTSHTHTFTSLTSKPTTLTGYGITDAAAAVHVHTEADVTNLVSDLAGKASTAHTHTFASNTSKPTTVSGYGITDGATLTGAEALTNKTIGGFNTALDAGANDSYVITLSPAPAAYTTGMMVIFRANTANTTGCTINVNGLGVKNIVKRVNTTMATGDILALMFCHLVYDGTNFVMLNPIVN